jgi:hypothetical protein
VEKSIGQLRRSVPPSDPRAGTGLLILLEHFVGPEIDRLWRLRRAYTETEMDQAPVALHRLEFVRWLVTTGRLTDQLA